MYENSQVKSSQDAWTRDVWAFAWRLTELIYLPITSAPILHTLMIRWILSKCLFLLYPKDESSSLKKCNQSNVDSNCRVCILSVIHSVLPVHLETRICETTFRGGNPKNITKKSSIMEPPKCFFYFLRIESLNILINNERIEGCCLHPIYRSSTDSCWLLISLHRKYLQTKPSCCPPWSQKHLDWQLEGLSYIWQHPRQTSLLSARGGPDCTGRRQQQ